MPIETPPQRQITFAAHDGGGKAGTGKTQQFFLNIGRDAGVAAVLHVAPVNAERRQPFLAVTGEHGGKIDRTGTFRAIETPHRLREPRVHVHGFTAVAQHGVTVSDKPTPSRWNFSAHIAASATPPMQESAMIH